MRLIYILIILCSMVSCLSDPTEKIPDISGINLDIQIQRFERDLFAVDTNNIQLGLSKLNEKYPDFSTFFFDELLGLGRLKNDTLAYERSILSFLNHPAILKLKDTCEVIYEEVDDLEKALTTSFKLYSNYFPNRPIPKIISCISEYSVGSFTYGENILVIGWDFFLGRNYPYYDPSIFPKYIRKSMERQHIVARTIEAYITGMVATPQSNRLLDHMIHNGKKLYILNKLLPFEPDSILLGYSAEQADWCKGNELAIWAHLINEDLIYSSDINKISKLINHAPHSPGMPETAPGRTANYIGMKIVESYMKRHPDISMEDLLMLSDPQQILKDARYKPPRMN